jgi:hypothetical protein
VGAPHHPAFPRRLSVPRQLCVVRPVFVSRSLDVPLRLGVHQPRRPVVVSRPLGVVPRGLCVPRALNFFPGLNGPRRGSRYPIPRHLFQIYLWVFQVGRRRQ